MARHRRSSRRPLPRRRCRTVIRPEGWEGPTGFCERNEQKKTAEKPGLGPQAGRRRDPLFVSYATCWASRCVFVSLETQELHKLTQSLPNCSLLRGGVVHAKLLQSCFDSLQHWAVAHQAPLSMGFSRQGYWEWVAISSSRRSS